VGAPGLQGRGSRLRSRGSSPRHVTSPEGCLGRGNQGLSKLIQVKIVKRILPHNLWRTEFGWGSVKPGQTKSKLVKPKFDIFLFLERPSGERGSGVGGGKGFNRRQRRRGRTNADGDGVKCDACCVLQGADWSGLTSAATGKYSGGRHARSPPNIQHCSGEAVGNLDGNSCNSSLQGVRAARAIEADQGESRR